MKMLHGDCLELMKDIPDGSVDMILCDLPYGTTACKWDTVIPFEPLWSQYKRVIKQNGAIVLFGQEPFSSHLRMSNMSQFKYDWIWKKSMSANYINAKNCPLKKHELISVFSHGTIANKSNRRMQYYPQGLKKVDKLHRRPAIYKTEHAYNRPSHKTERVIEYAGYPDSILEYAMGNSKNRHPSQKPVALIEYLIRTYTNEGETVLDNCMGSGTTGVACVNANRRFIGIEQDDKYFEVARKRINEAEIEYLIGGQT